MAGQNDDTDKSFEPTPQKLQEARRKGDVPKSQDLNATAAYLGLFLVFLLTASTTMMDAATALMVFLDQPEELIQVFENGRASAGAGQVISQVLPFLLVLFGIPVAAVLLSAIAQQSVTFAPEKILPKLNRINPIDVAKQKFGPTGIFEFAKSALKLTVFSICLAIFIYYDLEKIASSAQLEVGISLDYLGDISLRFLSVVIVVSLVIGAGDFLFQLFDHRRKLRMSHKEIRDEVKQNEGDPHTKQQRQQRARDIALDQSLSDVETADVVITNPTHYAIALHWDRTPGSAPKCVAKGVDETARAIRERAMEHGVPIHEDPPTARALHATTNVGEEIPPDLYQAVATAVRFAEAIRQKVRKRGF